ncbi:heavy-metal-associated domain-containing protein [bacterium]|nr:heavy-metal-associated domain-containing protein [bacterium]
MKKTFLLTLMAAASWSASAYAAHTADVPSADTLQVTTTPQMHCENCEKKIKSNIRFVKGVKKIETSVPEQKVTIIYNPKKSTYQDFVKAFKKIGYDIAVAPSKK